MRHRAWSRQGTTTHRTRTRNEKHVRVSGSRSDGTTHGLVDWVGEPRSYTPWLDQG